MPAYDAAHRTAVVIDRSGEGRLRVTGTDRIAWLQGLLTNDIAALAPGQGCYAAYLTPQGRMISDLRVLVLADALLLDVPAVVRATVLERFDQFIITEDVAVEDVTAAVARLGLHGPAAPMVLAQAFADVPEVAASAATLAEHAHVGGMLDGAPIFVAGSRDLGLPGFDLYCASAQVPEIAARLAEAGALDVDPETWDTLRIEAGLPVFGVDMDGDTIPLEAGLEDRAISQTKGCYVGQEIVIRILHRGGGRVARRLMGLQAAQEGEAVAMVPSSGTPVRLGDRDVGRVTSAAWSPRLGRTVAMAYVHRDSAIAGTALIVANEPPIPVTVVALPFVSPEP